MIPAHLGAGPGSELFGREVYRRLVNRMPVGVTIARWEDANDPLSFRFIWCNQAAKNISGRGRGGHAHEEFLGKTLREALPELADSGVAELYALAMTTGETQELGRLPVNVDGEPDATFRVQAIRVDHELLAILYENITALVDVELRRDAAFLDLSASNRTTEQHRDTVLLSLAESERANQELEKFAYVASHDLKAPLLDVDHLSTWVLEDLGDSIPPGVKRNLELMRNRVVRMEALLDDLLEYSRAGRIFSKSQKIVVDDLIGDVVLLVGGHDGIEIIYAKNPTLVLETPKAPLALVLRNLVSNAIKHHDKPRGKIQIIVRTTATDLVEFSVTDDGPGIPEEFHSRVFEMFQTLKPRDEIEGTGMGLALVEKVVGAHGGRILLESPGSERGTTFRVSWPLSTSSPQKTGPLMDSSNPINS